MKLNLKEDTKKKGTKKSLSLGLNVRDTSSKGGSGVNIASRNVLEDSSDDDNDDSAGPSDANLDRRKVVNEELMAEQAAIRARAQKAMAEASAASSSNIYDYDSFHVDETSTNDNNNITTEHAEQQQEKKSSRYIGDLLQASKKRQIERDLIFERKVLREQETEEKENELEFQGKEKFITKAYKKKLEERRKLEQEEKEQQKKEEEDDIAQKSGGKDTGLIANFYGNLNRNVAMGSSSTTKPATIKEKKTNAEDAGNEKTEARNVEQEEEQLRQGERKQHGGGQISEKNHDLGNNDVERKRKNADCNNSDDHDDGHARSDSSNKKSKFVSSSAFDSGSVSHLQSKDKMADTNYDKENEKELAKKAREEKLAKARLRYFQRQGIVQ